MDNKRRSCRLRLASRTYALGRSLLPRHMYECVIQTEAGRGGCESKFRKNTLVYVRSCPGKEMSRVTFRKDTDK